MRPTLAALVAPLLLAAAARAQPVADHLKCYKVKDSQAKTTYTADLGGLIAEPGCIIKVPGNLFCTQATKTNVTPPPLGGVDNTGPAGRFLCYKVKCPKATVAPFQWHDQFGDRQLTPSTPKILCAPEILATTSTTTTTTTSSTTTTTLESLGTACTAGTECASGFCVTGVCCATSCAMMAPSTCGTTGSCDPNGTACQLYGVGTACGASSCNGDTFTSVSTCDGNGNCDPGTMSSCSPYVCTVGGCKTSCTTAADCTAGFTCTAGACVVLGGPGAPCTTNSQCASNICVANQCQ